METRTGTIQVDSTSLYWNAWLPDNPPKAVLHVIHGYAEHIGRYGNVVAEVIPAGYAVFGTDHRGHGKSPGRRGYVKSFQDFIDDERQFAREVITSQFPGIPYFVLGHSMGSIIAMNYAQQCPEGIRGLILSGTGYKFGAGVPKILEAITKILSKILPTIHVKNPLPPEFISRDLDVVKAFVDDPLVYNVITPRLAEQMQTFLAIGVQNIGRLKMPVLIQIGSQDTSFSGQREFFDAVGSSDKTYKLYEGLRHEVYNELPVDRAVVLSDLHAWLDSHL